MAEGNKDILFYSMNLQTDVRPAR